MIFARRRGRAPCPSCDESLMVAEVLAATTAGGPRCPACGAALLPATVAWMPRRLLGGLVDVVILALTALPLHWFVRWLVPHTLMAPGARGIAVWIGWLTTPPLALVRHVAPLLVLVSLYLWVFWALSGRTPGQAALGVRVVDARGQTPHPARALARVVIAMIGTLPLGLGLFWSAFDIERRTLQDRIAGTWVVRDLGPALAAPATMTAASSPSRDDPRKQQAAIRPAAQEPAP